MGLDFGLVGIRKLLPNTFAGDIAREFVQAERNRQSLFASHPAIAVDLTLKGHFGVHGDFPVLG